MTKYLVPVLSFLVLASCSQTEVPEVPEIPRGKLVERHGLTYQVNSNKPFTGSTVSFQDNGEVDIVLRLVDRENQRDAYGIGQEHQLDQVTVTVRVARPS